MHGVQKMNKYRRVKDRSLDKFPEPFWKVGFEFEGKAFPEYNQVEEYAQDGSLLRIHVLDQLEECK